MLRIKQSYLSQHENKTVFDAFDMNTGAAAVHKRITSLESEQQCPCPDQT